MKENIVARRYAKAITGVVREKASLNKVITDLHNISNVIERSDELKNVFYNPSIRMKFKEGVLSQLINRLNPVPPINNLLYLILRKDRIKYLGKIIFVLEELSDQILNRVRVNVKTAFELDKGEIDILRKRFTEVTKKDVILKVSVDHELIGGIVTQIGSTVFDGSIKNQLRLFRK